MGALARRETMVALQAEIRRRFPYALLTLEDRHGAAPAATSAVSLPGSALARLGLWPVARGSVVALEGRGCTSLVWAMMARARAELRERVAYVDGQGAFFPPGAAACGVDLDNLLWLGCPDLRRAMRAAELLLGSGLFGLVVLDPPRGTVEDLLGRRVAVAVARSEGRLVVLERPGVRHALRVDRRVVLEGAEPSWLQGLPRCGAAGWRLRARPPRGGAAVGLDTGELAAAVAAKGGRA